MIRMISSRQAAGVFFAVVMLFPGCSTLDEMRKSSAQRASGKEAAAARKSASAEHQVFRSMGNWKKTTYRNKELLATANPENVSVEISLSEQRGFLLVNGAMAMDFPVATGKKSHPTPEGSFTVRAKQRDYSSNLYGKIFDATGVVVVTDADTRTDLVPEGGKFVGASMPCWMRLTDTGVGMHVGYVPGHPASHGCIRLKRDNASELFELVKVGTPVVIATNPLASQQPGR